MGGRMGCSGLGSSRILWFSLPLVPHLDFLSPSPHAHSLALFDHRTPVWV